MKWFHGRLTITEEDHKKYEREYHRKLGERTHGSDGKPGLIEQLVVGIGNFIRNIFRFPRRIKRNP